MKNLMQTQPGFLIFWKILTNHYRMVIQITINYWSLHKCSSSSQIIGWVRLVIIELSNGWETVVVIQGFDLWCIEKIEFSDEGSFDVDHQWFSSLWNGSSWKTRMSILNGKWQCIHANKHQYNIFLVATSGSCQRFTSSKGTKKTYLLA